MKLVLVSLEQELKHLVSVLSGAKENTNGYSYKDYQFVLGGMGKLNFALNTCKYTQLYKPEKLYALGSCGGLKAFNILEVVVVASVVEHDFESLFFKKPMYTSSSKDFIHLKRVFCASGDKDIVTQKDKNRLLESFDADIVTWESAGFFKAAHMLKIPFVEIRVVTDMANTEIKKGFKKNLSLGMQKIGKLFK